jgi:hypothetical protein
MPHFPDLAAGQMYLIQERELKSKYRGLSLPLTPLEAIDDLAIALDYSRSSRWEL